MSNQFETIETKIKALKKMKEEKEKELQDIKTLLEWELFYLSYSVGTDYVIDIKKFNLWLEQNSKVLPRLKTVGNSLDFAYNIYLDEMEKNN